MSIQSNSLTSVSLQCCCMGIMSLETVGYPIQVCCTLCQGCSYTRRTWCKSDSQLVFGQVLSLFFSHLKSCCLWLSLRRSFTWKGLERAARRNCQSQHQCGGEKGEVSIRADMWLHPLHTLHRRLSQCDWVEWMDWVKLTCCSVLSGWCMCPVRRLQSSGATYSSTSSSISPSFV